MRPASYLPKASIRTDRREWSFHYRLMEAAGVLPAVWLSGQADRVLFYSDGTLGVIDYKTDQVSATSMQQTAHYRLQLAGVCAGGAGGVWTAGTGCAFISRAYGSDDADRRRGGSLGDSGMGTAGNRRFIRSHPDEFDYVCRTSHCPVCPFQPVCVQG